MELNSTQHIFCFIIIWIPSLDNMNKCAILAFKCHELEQIFNLIARGSILILFNHSFNNIFKSREILIRLFPQCKNINTRFNCNSRVFAWTNWIRRWIFNYWSFFGFIFIFIFIFILASNNQSRL